MRQTLPNTYFEYLNTNTWLGWFENKIGKIVYCGVAY